MSDSPERIPYCQQTLGEEETAAVLDVLRGGWIARGPLARELEGRCAARLDASHAIACSSGSAALEIALRGLDIGPGDEVLVPTLTWVATAMAVRLVGATPVFVDIHPATRGVTEATLLARWTPRTRAVIAVDMTGVPVDGPGLRAMCESRGAYLIQDAAHSFGARFEDGRPVGCDGAAHVTTFSFHPAKTITTAEGGLLTTDDEALAARLRTIRSGGVTRDFEGSRGPWDVRAVEIGSNFHLTELQAAIGLVQLERTDDFVARRRAAGEEQLRQLADLPGLLLPVHPEGSSWNLLVVELDLDDPTGSVRDQVLRDLRERGVMAHVHYPLLHRQPVFEAAEDEPLLAAAARYEACALTLPLFAHITPDQQRRVTEALREVLSIHLPTAPAV